MKILVLNSGSSSLKFQLFDMPEGKVICSGQIERIGLSSGAIDYSINGQKINQEGEFKDHESALEQLSELLTNPEQGAISTPNEIDAVGHRVVHGGETFKETTLISEDVKKKIKELFSLAPLHNPANFQGIEVAEKVFVKARQVAVFDTAFHSSIPSVAFRYAIPNHLYQDLGIRAYGFHGTSHRYVARETIKYLDLEGRPSNIITLHLGNGCSMAAIKDGVCIDTSMGLGPLSGLVMGTRSGDIDPSIIFYLQEQGHSNEQIKKWLNKESGLKGLTDESDMRSVNQMAENGNSSAQLALDLYAYRIKKYIGAYTAALNGLDAIVFTAGVGENDAATRSKVCRGMEYFGISISDEENQKRGSGIREIQSGKTGVLIVPTNEELEIANQCYGILGQKTNQ